LGDANTGSATAAIYTGGAYNIGKAVGTNSSSSPTGNYIIGGGTDNSSTFSGNITATTPLTFTQVATTGGNALHLNGGIGTKAPTIQTLTFAGPGAIVIGSTTAPTAHGINIYGGAGGTLNMAVSVTGGTLTLASDNLNFYFGDTTIAAGAAIRY